MSKAFTRESDAAPDEDDDDPSLPPLPAGTRNYMTPAGYRRLREELMTLLDVERPKVVEAVSWAAKNGDRSENGDYLYGKKRLREIDRRIRFLTNGWTALRWPTLPSTTAVTRCSSAPRSPTPTPAARSAR